MLKDLKPLKVYCLQVQAQLSWALLPVLRSGHLSNISCHETTADGKMCLPVPFWSWEKSAPETGKPGSTC